MLTGSHCICCGAGMPGKDPRIKGYGATQRPATTRPHSNGPTGIQAELCKVHVWTGTCLEPRVPRYSKGKPRHGTWGNIPSDLNQHHQCKWITGPQFIFHFFQACSSNPHPFCRSRGVPILLPMRGWGDRPKDVDWTSSRH